MPNVPFPVEPSNTIKHGKPKGRDHKTTQHVTLYLFRVHVLRVTVIVLDEPKVSMVVVFLRRKVLGYLRQEFSIQFTSLFQCMQPEGCDFRVINTKQITNQPPSLEVLQLMLLHVPATSRCCMERAEYISTRREHHTAEKVCHPCSGPPTRNIQSLVSIQRTHRAVELFIVEGKQLSHSYTDEAVRLFVAIVVAQACLCKVLGGDVSLFGRCEPANKC